jgi:hypothetical protein
MIGLQPEGVDLVALRATLQAMSEAELVAFGRSMREIIYPRRYDFHGKPTVSSFSIHLDEARAEWRRRHPRPVDVGCLC